MDATTFLGKTSLEYGARADYYFLSMKNLLKMLLSGNICAN